MSIRKGCPICDRDPLLSHPARYAKAPGQTNLATPAHFPPKATNQPPSPAPNPYNRGHVAGRQPAT
ncbi:hypothetical protein FBX98_107305 [Burkholderia sp. SJZ115]|nr:hypothetical protein FB600_10744 [Burkholderia sp. SJZ089]TWD02545.1 hypothetical protein FBX98_107305 [Burkholderia sp. SJZ115]